MNYALILAAGSGTRIKSIDIPKQFYEINNIPVIIYTLNTFLNTECFNHIYITVNINFKELMNDTLLKHLDKKDIHKITLIDGGLERIDSIHNFVEFMKNQEISDDDLIVIHDAVRPFVTKKIIFNSIKHARIYGACVNSISVNDTMFKSQNGNYIGEIPLRKTLYHGQSPDSFNLKKFIEFEGNLTDKQKKYITGTSEIFMLNNHLVKLIPGDIMNFKITNDIDLKFAEFLINSLKT